MKLGLRAGVKLSHGEMTPASATQALSAKRAGCVVLKFVSHLLSELRRGERGLDLVWMARVMPSIHAGLQE